MNCIFVEPGFADSLWGRQLLEGLTAELKKRRQPFQLQPSRLQPEATAFVIGTTPAWLGAMVQRCNGAGIVPVLLCSSLRKLRGGRYHCVRPDIEGAMGSLLAMLGPGCRPALYGINPHSVGDRSRAELFAQLCDRADIYENRGSLAQCFAQLQSRLDCYDAVICANGLVALSLRRRLRALGKQLRLYSCTRSQLLDLDAEGITAMDVQYPGFGRAALGIVELARKMPELAELSATVQCVLPRQTALPLPELLPLPTGRDRIYDDDELQRLLGLENMLSACDDTDHRLLTMLLQDKSYAQMAEACFLTEGAVKYRIKGLRARCGCATREALVQSLREYLAK